MQEEMPVRFSFAREDLPKVVEFLAEQGKGAEAKFATAYFAEQRRKVGTDTIVYRLREGMRFETRLNGAGLKFCGEEEEGRVDAFVWGDQADHYAAFMKMLRQELPKQPYVMMRD